MANEEVPSLDDDKAADRSARDQYMRNVGEVIRTRLPPAFNEVRAAVVEIAALIAAEAWGKGRREAFAEAGVRCMEQHPTEYPSCERAREHEGPHQSGDLTWEQPQP